VILNLGLDEVGRGAVAGPVVVGAVLLPDTLTAEDVRQAAGMSYIADSKHLSLTRRSVLAGFVQQHFPYSIGSVPAEVVDSEGITAALTQAADQTIAALLSQTQEEIRIYSDAGLRHSYSSRYLSESLIRGDETVLCIMLASVVAKVWRDQHMREMARIYPHYGWERNAGYGTASHYQALNSCGLTYLHRKSFLKVISEDKAARKLTKD
jgi:ribonuclease HII